MSHFDYDLQEKADFFYQSPDECKRCEAKSSNGEYLTDVMTFEGKWERLCDDCAAADAKSELIMTEYVHPPIPDRSMDWAACVDGQEEWITGRGATRAAAINDLVEQAEERRAS
jgi:hypothetical protein